MYSEKRAELLVQLRDLEIKEAHQRYDSEHSSLGSRLSDLSKRL